MKTLTVFLIAEAFSALECETVVAASQPVDPDHAPIAAVDRFSDSAGTLDTRLPGPNEPIDFDRPPLTSPRHIRFYPQKRTCGEPPRRVRYVPVAEVTSALIDRVRRASLVATSQHLIVTIRRRNMLRLAGGLPTKECVDEVK